MESEKIPLIKKIIDIGRTSKGIILPKSWLDFLEERYGKIKTVTIEINGKLTIRPILKEMSELNKSSGKDRRE